MLREKLLNANLAKKELEDNFRKSFFNKGAETKEERQANYFYGNGSDVSFFADRVELHTPFNTYRFVQGINNTMALSEDIKDMTFRFNDAKNILQWKAFIERAERDALEVKNISSDVVVWLKENGY